VWTFAPISPFDPGAAYCIGITQDVYDLSGRALARPFTGAFTTARTGDLKPLK